MHGLTGNHQSGDERRCALMSEKAHDFRHTQAKLVVQSRGTRKSYRAFHICDNAWYARIRPTNWMIC